MRIGHPVSTAPSFQYQLSLFFLLFVFWIIMACVYKSALLPCSLNQLCAAPPWICTLLHLFQLCISGGRGPAAEQLWKLSWWLSWGSAPSSVMKAVKRCLAGLHRQLPTFFPWDFVMLKCISGWTVPGSCGGQWEASFLTDFGQRPSSTEHPQASALPFLLLFVTMRTDAANLETDSWGVNSNVWCARAGWRGGTTASLPPISGYCSSDD